MATFITSTDVITALAMKEITPNTEYELYGEKIPKTMIDAQVQYANDYLTYYAGELKTTDSTWTPAKLAALAMAKIRIVVVAMGWTLKDNISYSVGEIRTNIDRQLFYVIQSNLETWREEFYRYMGELTKTAILSNLPVSDWVDKWKKGDVV